MRGASSLGPAEVCSQATKRARTRVGAHSLAQVAKSSARLAWSHGDPDIAGPPPAMLGVLGYLGGPSPHTALSLPRSGVLLWPT